MLAAAERHIDNVSDDDEEKEEGTAHNLAHVSLIAQAQHNIKHAMYIYNSVCALKHFQRV